MISASAPGKILLTGEYAVLYGSPAIVTAVDCRAEVSLRDAAASVLRTRGYQDGQWPFESTADGIVFGSSCEKFPLFEAAFLASNPRRPIEIELDTRAFSDPATCLKYGLGSSAALVVAMIAALNVGCSPKDLLPLAMDCHRDYQGGKGSGADIAAAVCGGVIEYRMGYDPVSTGWPDDLQLCLFWSGQPASTTGKIGRLQESLAGSVADPALQQLSQAAAIAAESWRNKKGALTALGRYTRALREFDNVHAIGIFGAGHDRLHEHAAKLGFLYKPCGAGGGDIGVLFTRQDDDISDFARYAAGQGFRQLDHRPDGSGVTVRNS